jgi:hypothetical protein
MSRPFSITVSLEKTGHGYSMVLAAVGSKEHCEKAARDRVFPGVPVRVISMNDPAAAIHKQLRTWFTEAGIVEDTADWDEAFINFRKLLEKLCEARRDETSAGRREQPVR